MWKILPDFAPLFLTLPEDFYRIEHRDEGNPEIIIPTGRRELLATDLARYNFYAPLVECVDDPTYYKKWKQSAGWGSGIHRPRVLQPSKELWAALEYVRPVPLPNLRRVEIWRNHYCSGSMPYQPSFEWFAPSYIFLGPSIETVDLMLVGRSVTDAPEPPAPEEAAINDHNIVMLLKALAASAHLSELRFGLKLQLPRTTAAFSDALCNLVGLVDVTIDRKSINARDWRHLSSLHTLRSLSCRASSPDLESVTDALTTTASFPPFPSLTDLHLMAVASLDMCTRLFGTVSSPTLSRIQLFSGNVAPTHAASRASFKAFTTAIVAHPAVRSIHTICIGTGLDGPRELDVPNPVALPANALVPLTTLSQLTHLELIGNEYYAAIDNSMVASMANAWPGIVTLSLCPCRIPRPESGDHRTSVTVAGLAPFADHPCLEQLNIRLADIDASALPPLLPRRRADESGVLTPRLFLGIVNARIDEQAESEFAVNVSTLFPRLAEITNFQWDPPGDFMANEPEAAVQRRR